MGKGRVGLVARERSRDLEMRRKWEGFFGGGKGRELRSGN